MNRDNIYLVINLFLMMVFEYVRATAVGIEKPEEVVEIFPLQEGLNSLPGSPEAFSRGWLAGQRYVATVFDDNDKYCDRVTV